MFCIFECNSPRDLTQAAQRHENWCLVFPLCVNLRRVMKVLTENRSAFNEQEGNLRTLYGQVGRNRGNTKLSIKVSGR